MKTYVKPVLRYENFQLNQSVASCGFGVNDDGSLAYDNTGTWTSGDGSFSNSNVCTDIVDIYGVYGADVNAAS